VKLSELAKLVKGEISGDTTLSIGGISEPLTAKAGDLVFVLDKKVLETAEQSSASALIVSKGTKASKPSIAVENPRAALAILLSQFSQRACPKPGIHKSAVVEASAKIGKNVSIGAFTYVGEGSEIGDDSIIYSNVSIYDQVKIGKKVIIHSGSVIGLDGFGFIETKECPVKIPQIGTVVIEDEVEIYSGSSVARATMGETRIGRGTKIDCHCHVAHNCKIGPNCLLAGDVSLSGSVTLGKNVIAAGGAGFRDHVTIGDNSVVLARAGVSKDFPPGSVISGHPAWEHKKELRLQAKLRRLLEEK